MTDPLATNVIAYYAATQPGRRCLVDELNPCGGLQHWGGGLGCPLCSARAVLAMPHIDAAGYARPLSLGDRRAAHLYDVEVDAKASNAHGQPQHIDAHAANRNQAAKLAKDAGFTVRSVNMIG